MKNIHALLLIGLLSFSCGIKGPPLPPIDEETIQKQKAADQAAQQAKAAGAASADNSKAKKKNAK